MPHTKLPDGSSQAALLPKRYFQDRQWIDDSILELTRQYPDQWIAVLNGKVVAAGKNLRAVIEEGRREADEEGCGQCVYDFIEAKVRFYAGPSVVSYGS